MRCHGDAYSSDYPFRTQAGLDSYGPERILIGKVLLDCFVQEISKANAIYGAVTLSVPGSF